MAGERHVVFREDDARRIAVAVRRVEKMPGGDSIIRRRHHGKGGDWSYADLFAVTDASTYGETPAYALNVAAGFACVNAVWIAIPAKASLAIPGGFIGADPDYGFIVAKADLDGDSPAYDEHAILDESAFLAGEADHAFVLIGRVRVVTGGSTPIVTIFQDQYGAAGGFDIPGECTTTTA